MAGIAHFCNPFLRCCSNQGGRKRATLGNSFSFFRDNRMATLAGSFFEDTALAELGLFPSGSGLLHFLLLINGADNKWPSFPRDAALPHRASRGCHWSALCFQSVARIIIYGFFFRETSRNCFRGKGRWVRVGVRWSLFYCYKSSTWRRETAASIRWKGQPVRLSISTEIDCPDKAKIMG